MTDALAAWADHDEFSTAKIGHIFDMCKKSAVNLPLNLRLERNDRFFGILDTEVE